MGIDRDSTLRRAEKLLRQGRLDAAIAEYQQVVEEQPRDWNTVNILGDLYVRAGQIESAVHQYTRVAEHFAREGFFQKASALYKKIVKIKPDDENSLLQSADLAEQQGLLADAKACLEMVADRRRRRGDRLGAAEVSLRLGRLDPGDVASALRAARAAADLGDPSGAAARFKAAGAELMRRGWAAEGLSALTDAASLNPEDADLREALLHSSLEAGQIERARQYAHTGADHKAIAAALISQGREREALEVLSDALRLEPADPETHIHLARAYLAGGELDRAREVVASAPPGGPGVAGALVRAELELRSGHQGAAREILATVLAGSGTGRDAVIALGLRLSAADPDAAFPCVDLVTDRAVAANDWKEAAAVLRAYLARAPEHVPSLMKLVEICVDGGLEATMHAAQAQLADAYLSTGRAAEARVIAEDLVAREPWRRENIDRFRRALLLLGELDPDRVIADLLCGDSPFLEPEAVGPAARPAATPDAVEAVAGAVELPAEWVEIDIVAPPDAEPAPAGVEPAWLAAALAGEVSKGPEERPPGSMLDLDAEPLPEPEGEASPPAEVEAAPEPMTEVAPEPASEAPAELALEPHAARAAGPAQEPVFEEPAELFSEVVSEVALEPLVEPESEPTTEPEPLAAPAVEYVRAVEPLAAVDAEPVSAFAAALLPAERAVDAVFDLGAGPIDLGAVLDTESLVSAAPGVEGPPPDEPEANLVEVSEPTSVEPAESYDADAATQHLLLAVAFRDMGMIGDSIRSLEVAARSPRHRFEAASGLAQTYLEQGRLRDAVEWFELAAETPAPSADAGRRLLYDLGRTLNDAGEGERALAIFLELQADAPQYRDVSAWVRRLSSTS